MVRRAPVLTPKPLTDAPLCNLHDCGVSTWPPQAWKIGGGNVWGWITYDAELNAVYHGTGNPGYEVLGRLFAIGYIRGLEHSTYGRN